MEKLCVLLATSLVLTILGSGQIQVDAEPLTVTRCCYPDVWQGLQYQYIAAQDIEWFNRIYEDYPNQMYAIYGVGTRGTDGSQVGLKYGMIMKRDSTGTKINRYDFDPDAQTCDFSQMNQTYDQTTDRCIPSTAVYRGVTTVGALNGLVVLAWKWIPDPVLYPGVWFERQVTATNCLPVSEINQGTLPNTHTTLHAHNYRNIRTFIIDRSVFTVPSYCITPPGM